MIRESTKKKNDKHGRVTTGKVIEKEEMQKGKENILRTRKEIDTKRSREGMGTRGRERHKTAGFEMDARQRERKFAQGMPRMRTFSRRPRLIEKEGWGKGGRGGGS